MYVVHPDGTGLRRLWRREVFAAFAPDSKRIALASTRGTILVVDLAGRARRVAGAACAWEPAFSPDFDRDDVDAILRGLFDLNVRAAESVDELRAIRRLLEEEDGDGDQEAEVHDR